MNSNRYSGAAAGLSAIITVVVIFAAPQASQEAVKSGLALCGGPLLLGIFPFLIVSELVVYSGCANAVSAPFRPMASLLSKQNRSGSAVLLLGALGGFAPAAAAIRALHRRGELNADDAALLLAAAAGSSPSFVILSVGRQMLGSTALGVRLYLSQLLASYISALLYRFFARHSGQADDMPGSLTENDSDPPDLSAIIGNAALTYVRLCGSVIYFRILTDACTALLPTRFALLPALLLEVSTGCSVASKLPLYAVYGCCAALSLQGASVLLQLRSICPKEIRLRPLLLTRPLQLLVSCGLLRISFFLTGTTPQTVFNSLEARVITLPRLSLPAGLLLFALCLLLCDQLCRTLQSAQK